MSSTNPTLINGFEDVMAHIRKLEEENKDLKEQIFLTKMQLAASNENADVAVHNEAAGIILAENNKLKEQVKYWKHFALTYWSDDKLGDLEINTTGSDVWCEALDECESNSDYDRKALTKKCMNA
jgi:hypothetical protein